MAFIGNSVQNQGFAPAVDYFNGDGTTVTFTLSRPVASVAQLTAVIENVIQNPATAFTVSGNQITFTSAPPAGTNNVWMEYTSLITQYNGISQDPSVVGDITASGGYLATGDFGNSYIDGTIVDYVTGNARITTGPSDGITLYNGGTSARTALMTIDSSGNVGVGTSSPSQKLDVTGSLALSTNATYLYGKTSGGTATRMFGINGANDLYIGGIDTALNSILFTNNGVQATLTSSGNFQFNSGYGSVATAYGCRAWANFNGTAATLTAGGGVTSVTRLGTGVYRINFSFTMPDSNYSFVAGDYNYGCGWNDTLTTTSCVTRRMGGTYGVLADSALCYAAIFR